MDKKIVLATLSITVVMAFAFYLTLAENQAAAQVTPFPTREKVITVTGEATISVNPDLLVIRFGVETEAKTAIEALAVNSDLMNAVVDAIKGVSIVEDELKTSSLNIFPVYESVKDSSGRYKSELVGYRVSNILTVETSNLTIAPDVIDAAVVAGVNKVESVSFTLSPAKQIQVKDDLLEKAVLNAKSKAEKALAPLDHQIIGVKAVSLAEFGTPTPQPDFKSFGVVAESAAFAAPTPVFVSAQEVRTTANVIFLIGSK